MSTSSYALSATTLPYILSKRFTWPTRGCDESRSYTGPTSMLDCSSGIPTNDSGHPSNTPHHHTTHENRQMSAAASDPGPQSSHRCSILHHRSSHSAYKTCPSRNLSKHLRNVHEDLNYRIRRFLEDSPYDEPWIAQGSCSDDTTFTTAVDAGDNNLGIHRRELRLKNLHSDGVLAGVGDWAKDNDA